MLKMFRRLNKNFVQTSYKKYRTEAKSLFKLSIFDGSQRGQIAAVFERKFDSFHDIIGIFCQIQQGSFFNGRPFGVRLSIRFSEQDLHV